MSRFFIPEANIDNDTVYFFDDDFNHIKNVLRKKVGDQIQCFNSKGTEFEAVIYEIEKDLIKAKIMHSYQKNTEPIVKITLAQSLPKGLKFDEIVQKSVELGVCEIIPFISERSIKKSDKLERWNKIAKESAEQCGRTIIPKVHHVLKFEDMLANSNKYKLKLLPWEGESLQTIKNVLQKTKNVDSILVTIGPEGGFSSNEVNLAKSFGFETISLGKRILRTQTAGPAVLSMILYEMEL